MNMTSLARSTLIKAEQRIKIVPLLHDDGAYSNVVRDAQEIVELCLKGMLRAVGVDPPKFHDVSDILVEHADRLPESVRWNLDRIAAISKKLRKDRELAFYGDIDFIPTEEYAQKDSQEALDQARFVVEMARHVIK